MSATDTFINTLKQTPALSSALQRNLQRLKDDLDGIIKVLGYTKTVSDDLDQLDNALKTTTELLTIVSVVPEVGEAASALKTSIATLSREVTPARQAADKLEAKVKPVRDALQKLDPILANGIKATGQINSTSQSFLSTFTAVVSCVNSLPDGQYKTQAQAYLDQFSTDAEPLDSGLNTALATANTIIEGFYSKLTALKNALNQLAAIAAAVQQVLSVLDPIMAPLKELEQALMTIKIPIPIPYPHLVSLYTIFEEFGKFIDLAMKPIQSLVDEVLKALHVTLPSIPGLSDLINLQISIPGIPDFSGLFAAITNAFDQLSRLIPRFSLKCPPEKGDTVPTWSGS